MAQAARGHSDERRWGHLQLGLIVADIIQRPVTIIMPNLEDGSETTFTFVPGFEHGKFFSVCFLSPFVFYA